LVHSISDEVQVYGAAVLAVTGSIMWPWVVAAAMYGKLPMLGWADLIRFGGATIIGLSATIRADRNRSDGEPSQRTTKAAVRRRIKAAFARGWAWQGFVAGITATLTGGGA
jgi:hypothetical protein